MSEEKEITEVEVENSGKAIDMAQETLEEFIKTADVSKVYGKPITHEDTLILPTAEVLAVAGFGEYSSYLTRIRWEYFAQHLLSAPPVGVHIK